MNEKSLTRKELREKYADEVCRELRHQIANNCMNELSLCNLIAKWLKVADKKTKYISPKQKETNP